MVYQDPYGPPAPAYPRIGYDSPIGPSADLAGGGSNYEGIVSGGMWASVFGAGLQSISAFYEAKNAQFQLESQALDAQFQQSMSNLNAREAEFDAQSILEAGQLEVGQTTMAYGQTRSSAKAAQAARGLLLGKGSTAEEIASIDYAKEADVLAINSNAARQAAAARMQGANYRTQGRMAGISAANIRVSRGSISPLLASGSTALSSAGEISSRWAYYKTRRY